MKAKIDFVFGIRSVIEAIHSEKEIEKVLLKKGLGGELFKELFNIIREFEIPFQFVPIEKIDRISKKNHQGVIAFISPVVYDNIENLLPGIFEQGKIPFLLILDKVSDVRNFGGISRSAECAGVDAIIIPSRGSAQINADAVKTSAGALHRIPVCRSMNLKQTIQFLKDSGLQIFGASEKVDNLYFNADYKSPLALIMGAEDEGISPEYLKMCDQQFSIPLQGKIASLNVSSATAVILFEAVRQRTNMNY
ncbi:MAG: 23S rRNA (guanosine(2251)-2'-O)-methyltransferase RlmB [Bacteroidota bacterium]|nr:23S rRNA (guanosine(2251)-2'-O)-methyltransferase RlmB [Bacteroidota bacterium]